MENVTLFKKRKKKYMKTDTDRIFLTELLILFFISVCFKKYEPRLFHFLYLFLEIKKDQFQSFQISFTIF